MHPYVEHINPYLGRLLQEIGMNKGTKKVRAVYTMIKATRFWILSLPTDAAF